MTLSSASQSALVCQRVAGWLLAIVVVNLSAAHCSGQWLKEGLSEIPRPIIDNQPFDLLTLNQNGEDAILKIKPLGDARPANLGDSRGQLVFEMFADYEDRLEVPYSSIAKIQSFNELLLEEASTLIAGGEYTKAFRNLLFVYDNGESGNPDVVSSMRDCMFRDATENFQNGRFELSLSIYEDIYERDPNFQVPGLNRSLLEIIMLCYNGIIQRKFDAEEYRTVRNNVSAVVTKYPETQAATDLQQKWEAAFLAKSDELLQRSRELASEGQGRLAHQAARQADQMVPDRPEVLAQQEVLLQQFPLVIVGVSQSGADTDPNRLEHWGARRVGRLTQRRILELTGISDEGGRYDFSNGTFFRADDAGLKYTFELQPATTRFGVPSLSAFELSMRLLERGQPDSPNYNEAWAKIVDKVVIEDETHVSFTLRAPFVRPEALLNMSYANPVDGAPVQNGMYVLASQNENISSYELNDQYPPLEGRQHPVIVEVLFPSASEAVDQLIRSNIDVVDRVPIQDLQRLRDDPEIQVRPYLLPTVHLLIPKIRDTELESDQHFRGGLSHLIDRQTVVQEAICGGQIIDGCLPISGPFPIGSDNNEEISYGYDLRAKPIFHNDPLGMVLTQLSFRANPPIRPEPLKAPSLTIAHPRSSTASNAARAIARMWSQAGIPTEARALPAGESIPADPNWDFLYLEVTIEEPLADASKLIGSHGFAKDVSAPVEQTLRILNYSRSWQSACSALRRLHRQVRVDLSIIPLWQLTEYYAHRNTVRNIGRDIVHLYQDVDRWKIDLTAEDEETSK